MQFQVLAQIHKMVRRSATPRLSATPQNYKAPLTMYNLYQLLAQPKVLGSRYYTETMSTEPFQEKEQFETI